MTFFGVRGSTPCSCRANQRYGGNTACVAIDAPGIDPLVLDLGTGLRFWGEQLPKDGSFRGHALVTHLHWDHVQGLPFFVPSLIPGAEMDVYGPPQEDGRSLAEAFDDFMRPPYFPVRISDLAGVFRFHTLDDGVFDIGGAKVTVRGVPHVGTTNGYRIEAGGFSVVYIPDHQQPIDGSHVVDPRVLELCHDADLLIHDAQYTPEEFEMKATWGHCTVDYALAVAQQAHVKRLALFHHDPAHGDEMIDRLHRHVSDLAAGTDVVEVLAAREGLTVQLGAAADLDRALAQA